ncbi:MAG: hypothetical protein ACE5KD_01880 [Candidatus Bathyarchaeia archaeon]
MKNLIISGLCLTLLVLLTGLVFAVRPFGTTPGLDRFKTPQNGDGELVIRYPTKAIKDKPFNIGLYISDVSVGGSTYSDAEMTVDVSGPAGATIFGWNSWFEAQGLFIEWGVSDLIVPPYNSIESFEHDTLVSKLNDISGWTGSIVCKADTIGTYEFTIHTLQGTWNFNIDVS